MYEHLNTATAFLSPHSTTATILETLLCMRFLFVLVLSPFTHKNVSRHFYKWAFKQLCIDVHRCQNGGTLLLSLGRHSGHVVCDIELENCTDSIKTVVQETARMASLPAGAPRNIIGIFMENVFTAGGCITARHQHCRLL